MRCGDNGIFKGVPVTEEQSKLKWLAMELYNTFDSDGKYILDDKHKKLIICQSNTGDDTAVFKKLLEAYKDYEVIINPLGAWTGGTDVDTGATNRKLGSDMGDAVTGGGLHGKDLSKADVSLNIYAHMKAQELGKEVTLCCAIGDEYIDGRLYEEIVNIAREYIKGIGGFEKLAEWGLI
jgi:S-adenosylmethionine synthetase